MNEDGDLSTVPAPRTFLALMDEVQVAERLGPVDHGKRHAHQSSVAYLASDRVQRLGCGFALDGFLQHLQVLFQLMLYVGAALNGCAQLKDGVRHRRRDQSNSLPRSSNPAERALGGMLL